ncbi:NB-ARC domain-containing protein [Phormidesmis priestleyi]
MVQVLQHPKRYRGFVLTSTGLQKLQGEMQRLETQTKVRQSSRTIAERVQLLEADGIHPITVRKMLRGQQGVDKRSICHVFEALHLTLEARDYAHTSLSGTVPSLPDHAVKPHLQRDFGGLSKSLIDVDFWGRVGETAQLKHRILVDQCRLVAVLGVEGIGKTALVKQVIADIHDEFECCVWKSLHPATPIAETLTSLLQTLSGESAQLPTTVKSLVTRLLKKLKQRRCLLVLDGVEAILENRPLAGYYRREDEAYGELFRAIAEQPHPSCLVLISQEKPRELKRLEGKFVQSMSLEGLIPLESQQLLQAQGIFSRSQSDLSHIAAYYAGNPLMLKWLTTRVWNYFDGNLSDYLGELSHGQLLFRDLWDLLDQQFDRLSELEQRVVAQLAVSDEGATLSQLQPTLARSLNQPDLLDVLDSLQRRSLLQKRGAYFKLSPTMTEFIRSQKLEATPNKLAISILVQQREHSATALV